MHTLFVILSSSFKGHLSLLSRLAFCLQDEGVKSALKSRAQREEILAAFQVAESRTAKIYIMEKSFQFPWQVPFGEFSLKLDPLSFIFLIAVSILVFCAGIYAIGYMRQYKGKKPMGLHVFFYLLLSSALVFIVLANNVILFLGAWEMMSISSYFLIVFHDEEPSVRRAGFLFLIASHCGTFLLILMFFLMAHNAGSMNFDLISHSGFSPLLAGVIFLLAIVGFGVKAGFLPISYLAASCASRGPEPCISGFIRGHDQDGYLRHLPGVMDNRRFAGLVRVFIIDHWCCERRDGGFVCFRPA